MDYKAIGTIGNYYGGLEAYKERCEALKIKERSIDAERLYHLEIAIAEFKTKITNESKNSSIKF